MKERRRTKKEIMDAVNADWEKGAEKRNTERVEAYDEIAACMYELDTELAMLAEQRSGLPECQNALLEFVSKFSKRLQKAIFKYGTFDGDLRASYVSLGRDRKV